MYLGYDRHRLPGPVGIRLIVSQRDPQAPQADQNRAAIRISDDAYHAFAFGCFNLGVYLKHYALQCNFQEADAIFSRAPNSGSIDIDQPQRPSAASYVPTFNGRLVMLGQSVVAESRLRSADSRCSKPLPTATTVNVELTDLKQVLVNFGRQVFVSLNLEFEWVQSD